MSDELLALAAIVALLVAAFAVVVPLAGWVVVGAFAAVVALAACVDPEAAIDGSEK